MNLLCFSIFDSAAATYNVPFFMTTKGQALRAFNDLVNDPTSTINKHPEDYSLVYVGDFDTESAIFNTRELGPDRIATARDFTGLNATPLSIAKEG